MLSNDTQITHVTVVLILTAMCAISKQAVLCSSTTASKYITPQAFRVTETQRRVYLTLRGTCT